MNNSYFYTHVFSAIIMLANRISGRTVMMRKRMMCLLIIVLMTCLAACSKNHAALLNDYWTDDSKAAENINSYIASVTDRASPDYIPAEDRIAVFDLDGTLMCETFPFCFEYMLFADYALNSGSDTITDEVRAVA